MRYVQSLCRQGFPSDTHASRFLVSKIQWFRENTSSGSGDGNGDQYSAGSQLPESGNTSKNKSFPVREISKLNRTTVSDRF